MMENLSDTVLAIMLVTLRLGPSIAFAPPFTLFRIPVTIRVFLSIGLSIWLVAARPDQLARVAEADGIALLVFGELLVGVSLALGLQLAFASILWAGRALDIQAGFGLALLADPTTNARIPLAGTILSYGAGMIFFTIGGHYDLIALWAASFDALPIGLRPVSARYRSDCWGYVHTVSPSSRPCRHFDDVDLPHRPHNRLSQPHTASDECPFVGLSGEGDGDARDLADLPHFRARHLSAYHSDRGN
jgi:hypothetical protein